MKQDTQNTRLLWDDIQANAISFAKRWKDARRENAEKQPFLLGFFKVFGVDDPLLYGSFEHEVRKSGTTVNWIDFFWPGQIAIEMKTRGKDLGDAYQQLKGYMDHVPGEDVPDLWMVCDFETFQVWRHSTKEKFTFKLKDFRKHIKRFANIAGYTTERLHDDQVEVNVKAAEKMAKLHDALKTSGYDGHDLEVYLVRLLFCLFADDTGIFPQDSFSHYIEASKPDGSDLSDHIARLFEVLNTPEEIRAKRTLLADELKQFRYINGGLFANRLPPADFDAKMRQTLIDCANFDWNKISPAIFGAMFQGVMDKTQRRELGAHYTSEENILKLINPLFMDELWQEFDRVKTDPMALDRFHEKISHLRFLDPACGCGNFLIITYRELRLLELEILKMKGGRQRILDISPLLKVEVEQFYGIEYEDFPCQIATVGMWLIDHQMNLRASEEFGQYYARLPLTHSATIVQGNALRVDWQGIVPKDELSFILGNPPFNGARTMSDAQKEDMLSIFEDTKGVGNLDYVTAWYKKAAMLMAGTEIKTAFVSTNSITQGEQVAILWKPLFEQDHIKINFGYRTFKWSNEAKGKAAVHCVIVGFSVFDSGSCISGLLRRCAPRNDEAKTGVIANEAKQSRNNGVTTGVIASEAKQSSATMNNGKRVIYDSDGTKNLAKNINPYLVDAPDIFIESRTKPLCGVPEIGMGNQPIDDGNYLFTEAEKADFLKKEPLAEQWFRPWMGADEFINGFKRHCLWLGNCPPSERRKMPEAMKRIEAVKKFRLTSKRGSTKKIADTPTRFQTENMPESSYVVIPEVSSERRKYIPIGFLTPDIFCSNKLRLMPDGTLYHFAVLTSIVHMAWTRVVTGRLEMRYQYSINIVYNNFPWPDATDEQKTAIEKLAQAILDARALFPDSSLADLYDPLTMPPELLKAHHNLDRAVMKLYGFAKDTTEAQTVALLMERYQKLAEGMK